VVASGRPRSQAKAAPRTYTIYIIELSRNCTKQPCALAPLYVGQTAHAPEHRFAQHKAGGTLASWKAHRFGLKLRYDLMAGIRPCSTREEAETAERQVAEALERRGHRVFWG
jgi:predicted GIY-YIG superfamily endonuclease